MATQSFGNFLREKREAAGLSQRQVSREFGYESAQFISNWERGKSTPPMGCLPRLISLYNLVESDFSVFEEALIYAPIRVKQDKLRRAMAGLGRPNTEERTR